MTPAASSRAGRRAGADPVRACLAAGMLTLTLAASGCAAGMPDEAAAGTEAADALPLPTPTATPEPSPDTLKASGGTLSAAPSGEGLVTTTPDPHSEVGELVKGFPADLLPVPPDSVILVTSALPVGDADVQEVSLNLRTSMAAEDLLTMYRTSLVAAGFTEAPPTANPQTDLAVESVFTRSGGDELISIGVLDADGARTVTIGGRVRTGP